jgi:hypothetical protein
MPEARCPHCFTALHMPAQVALLTTLVVAEAARGRGVGRQWEHTGRRFVKPLAG